MVCRHKSHCMSTTSCVPTVKVWSRGWFKLEMSMSFLHPPQNLGTIKCSNLCTEIVEYSSPEEVGLIPSRSYHTQFILCRTGMSPYTTWLENGFILSLSCHTQFHYGNESLYHMLKNGFHSQSSCHT